MTPTKLKIIMTKNTGIKASANANPGFVKIVPQKMRDTKAGVLSKQLIGSRLLDQKVFGTCIACCAA